MTIAFSRRTLSRASLMVAAALLGAAPAARAEDLSFSGNGNVRILASDWADYQGGSQTFSSINFEGRLYWRGGAGDGQFMHFDLARLQGITLTSGALITLQNANATWGGGVDGSFIATANSAWTAAGGASVPGATAIGDATNATGSYANGASVSWGVSANTFQNLVLNPATFNGFAIIGGSGSQLHFNGPMNPHLTVGTSASMAGVVTVSGGNTWSNYSFADGVLTITGPVAGGQSGAGNVTINALGTVLVDGNSGDNYYWAVDSTRINTGGVLVLQGHSHLHNLTLAGGELAGIRPNGTYGGWTLDDATTVTGGVVSTISAQQVNLDNGSFNVETGATLNFTGSIRSGSLTKTGNGFMVLSANNTYSGATTVSAGTLQVGNGGASGTIGSGAATIAQGAVLEINRSNEYRTANGQAFSGAGTLRKTGPGALIIPVNMTGLDNLVVAGGLVRTDGWNPWKDGLRLTVTGSGQFELWNTAVTVGELSGDGTVRNSANWSGYAGGIPNISPVNHLTVQSGDFTGIITDSGQGNGGNTGTDGDTRLSLFKTGAGTLVLSGANTYGGVTTFAGGVLQVASLADNGTASSLGLGNGDTDSANIGLLFQGGTLRYAGSTAQSTDRAIRLSTTGGGGTIDASGSVPSATLSFTRTSMPNWWENGGERTLTLTGTNTGENTLAAGVNDLGPATTKINVTKDGAGTWVLAGAGNYVGLTNINAGTLLVTNNTSLGVGGWDGATKTNINDGGTLALRGGISLDEHMHVWGAGVGGLGAIRSLSGDNALTIGGNNGNGFALRSDTVVGVDADTFTVTGFYEEGGTFSLTKVGDGTLVLTANNAYNGGTIVNGGTLVLPGNGGNGRIRGALTVNAGATVSTTGDGTGFGYNNQLTSLTINGGLLTIGTSSSHIWNITGGVSMTGGEMSGTTFQWNRTALSTNASANSAVISGGINLRNDAGYSSWNVSVADGAADTDLLVSAAITGGGVALTKSGNGKMSLTGGVSFNGAINVNGGLLELPNGDWTTGDPWGNGNGKGLITIGAGATLSLSAGVTQFRNGLTMNGGTLSSRGLIYAGGWRNVVISSDVTAGGAAVSTISSVINLDGNRSWTVGPDSTLNVTGQIGSANLASGSLTKAGNGTLSLSGDNSYAGATTINGGTLVLDAGGSTYGYAGGNIAINNGSTLRVSGVAYTFNGKTIAFGAAGGGTLDAIATGGGGMYLTGGNTITTSGGAQNTLSGTKLSGGNQGINLNTQTLAFDVAVGADPAVPNLNITGTLWNSGNLTKSGNGILLLSGDNEYSGATTINAGTLVFRGASASSSYAISTGTTLEFDVAVGERDSVTTTFTGAGTLRKTGAGAVAWNGSTATFALDAGALIDVRAGTFTGGSFGNENWSNNKSDLNVEAGATFSTVEANVRVNRITGAGTIKTGYGGAGYQNLTIGVENGTSAFGGVIEDAQGVGHVVKEGTGAITLSGASTFTGTTSVNDGTIALAGAGSLNGSSGVTIGGANSAAFIHNSSVALTPSVTLTNGSVAGNGTFGALTIADLATNTLAPGTAGVGSLTVGTLTFLGQAGIDFTATGTAATNALSVGSLNLANPGAVTLNVLGVPQGSWVTGTYELLTYATTGGVGAAGFVKGTISGATTRTISDLKTDVVGKVSLVISSETPKWTGAEGAVWKVGSAGNWKLSTGTTTDYLDGDAVLFDDSATNRQVLLGGGVEPTTVIFNNALPYSIEALSQDDIGFITGETGLVKNGSGDLQILTLNDYTGATVINAGKIIVDVEAQLGFRASLTLAGGQLDLGGTQGEQTVGAVTITGAAPAGDTIGNGALVATSYVASHASGDAIIGATLRGTNATFTKTGNGTLTLSGDNTFNGGFTLNGGRVNVNSDTALGTTTFVINGGSLDNTSGAPRSLAGLSGQTWNADFTFIGSGSLDLGNTPITLSGNRMVTVGGSTLTVGAPLSGAVSLTKSGNGTLALTNAANTYSGGTTVNGGTLLLTGAYPGGVLILNGGRFVNGAAANTSYSLTSLNLNGGELAATSSPDAGLGNYQLRTNVTVGGSSMSTISADVRVVAGEDRVFEVADVVGGVDLLISGKLGHHSGSAWGFATKTGAGTLKISGLNEIGRLTVGAGLVILENTGIGGMWNGGLVNNAVVELRLTTGSVNLGVGVSGSGSVTKTGDGTVALQGNNAFAGGLTIGAGTLTAVRNSLGSGAVVVNNGATLYANDQWVFCGWNGYGEAQRNIASLTLDAGATLHMDPTAGFANGITHLFINGGTITGGANADSRGALYLYNGHEQITAGGGVTSTIGVSFGINANNNSITVETGSRLEMTNVLKDGAFTNVGNSGGFIKNGAGTLALSGANSFSGLIDITAGTVIAASNTALGAGGFNGTAMSFIRNGATLALQGGVSLDEHFHVWGAGVGGLGAIRSLSGDNVLTVSYNGGAGISLRSDTTVGVDAGTLTIPGFYQEDAVYGLTKVGNGTLSLTAPNSYTGATTINGGTLRVNSLGTSGNSSVGGSDRADAANLRLNGAVRLEYAGAGEATSRSFTVSGSGLTLASSGSGALDFTSSSQVAFATDGASARELRLAGVNTGENTFAASATGNPVAADRFSRIVKNEVGKWVIAGSGALADNLQVEVNGGLLAFGQASTLGSGSAVVNGGTLMISSGQNPDASVVVNNGGTLGGSASLGAVTVNNGGALSPGSSPGVLSASSLSLSSGAIINWQVLDATGLAGIGYDQLIVGGILDLSGATSENKITLKISSLSGLDTNGNPLNFGPPNGAASSRTFQFGLVDGIQLNNGTQNISDVFAFDVSDFRYSDGSASSAGLWSISWDSGTGAITLTAVPEPSTYGLGLGALALAAAALRRRRRHQAPKVEA